MSLSQSFTQVANVVSRWAGRPLAFLTCCAMVIVWGLSGPIFRFSDTWQLVINTSTTIITFLMVFLIQNTQNRDNAALQAKLDELIRTSDSENKFIGIEHLSDKELEEILEECERNRPDVVDRARAKAEHNKKAKAEAVSKPAPTRRRAAKAAA